MDVHTSKKRAGQGGGEFPPMTGPAPKKPMPYSLKFTPTANVRPFLYMPMGAYLTSLYQ